MEKDIGAEIISKLEELNEVLTKKAIEMEELRKENKRLKKELENNKINEEDSLKDLMSRANTFINRCKKIKQEILSQENGK